MQSEPVSVIHARLYDIIHARLYDITGYHAGYICLYMIYVSIDTILFVLPSYALLIKAYALLIKAGRKFKSLQMHNIGSVGRPDLICMHPPPLPVSV